MQVKEPKAAKKIRPAESKDTPAADKIKPVVPPEIKQASNTPTPAEKIYPAELKDLLERGNRGDASVLPEIRKAFDDHPEMAAQLGDMVRHAEQSLLTLAAGDSVPAKEAISRQVGDLRSRLSATATSELERLLIDRICLCWLSVYYADVDQAHLLLTHPNALAAGGAATKRLDRAHARFLSAVKALAVVSKLVKPALSPLDLLNRPASDTTTTKTRSRGRSVVSPALGVPVLN